VIVATCDLAGPALDWAVDEAEGLGAVYLAHWLEGGDKRYVHCQIMRAYSEHWAQLGPLIDRYRVTLAAEGAPDAPVWVAALSYSKLVTYYTGAARRFCTMRASTPLQAAARCIVASVLGDTVDVPGVLAVDGAAR
jgi:hypothetical protein